MESVPEPIGVVAAVAEQLLCVWQVIQQGSRAGVVADLARGHEEVQGAAIRVGDGMELRVHAAFGASDQAAGIPFLGRCLDAVRCAFRYVASITTVFGSASPAASPPHHARENASLAPALPSIVQRLVRTIGAGRISPAQPVAVDKDDANQDPPVIHSRLAMAVGKERPQPLDLLVRQLKQGAHPGLLAEPESDRDPHINGS